MQEKLNKNLIEKWEDLSSKAGQLEHEICNRITYIISFWMTTFDGKLNTWWFDGADEGQVGSLADHMDNDQIWSIWTECRPNPQGNDNRDMVIINKFGHEWGWDSAIPARWLFEDFEEEVTEGKKKYDQNLLDKKAKKEQFKKDKRATDALILEKVKAKLTPEEIKVLKNNL